MTLHDLAWQYTTAHDMTAYDMTLHGKTLQHMT